MFVKVFAIHEKLKSGECVINTEHISHMLDNHVTMVDGTKYFVQDKDVIALRAATLDKEKV
jgi:hypothetical protein